MHGASGSWTTNKLWWGLAKPVDPSRGPAVLGPVNVGDTPVLMDMSDALGVVWAGRVHNIFQSSDPAQRFLAGGLIDQQGNITDKPALHRSMMLLAQCMDEAGKKTPSPPDNPGLPSGYTYLLQFIAHDMSDSVASLVQEDGAMRPGGANARQRALFLDTLYGMGPESHGHAFAVSDRDIIAFGGTPRTYLRVGAREAPMPGSKTTFCPYRDLARAAPPVDDKLSAGNAAKLTEVYLVDRRNDAHSFLSQLTVLFQLLHNDVVSRLESLPAGDGTFLETHRRFLCARMIVTLIYREIIAQDLLGRLLDPAIHQRYRTTGKSLLDGEAAVPIEFTHGAFRFAHSIVRDKYKVRSDMDEETMIALGFNSQATPSTIKLPQKWHVDWARFFDTPVTPALNLSKCIGPRYPAALRSGLMFPAKTTLDGVGLANRDLLTACYSGLLSVPALCAKMRTLFGEAAVQKFDDWRAPLRTWLTTNWPGGGPPLSTDLDRLVEDPPLPFFVMFEAEQAKAGKTLGAIGSIIVAETIYGAMSKSKTGFETSAASLKGRIDACASAVFPDRIVAARAAVEPLGAINSMPAVLKHLADVGELKAVGAP